MDKKKLISLFFLSLFMVSFIPGIVFAQDDDRSYSIPKANIDLFIQDNGNLRVRESLFYSFDGTYRGVFREIPLKTNESIENLNIITRGAYSSYEVSQRGNLQIITIFLYSDPQKTTPITSRDVEVIIEYDFINVVTIYNDVAELQYKMWGDEWEVDVGEVNTRIHFPSQEGVKYWLNPPYFTKSSLWQGNILNVTSTSISPGNFFEVRAAIPLNQFNNPVFARRVDMDGLLEMERIQQEYEDELNFYTILYSILSVLMLLSIVLPVLIYFKYGREPKIDYQAEYERELPSSDPPAVINAISGSGFGKSVGDPNMDGFRATIMDLIDRNYLKLGDIPSNLDEDKKGESIYLEVNPNKDLSKLHFFEKDVISFLSNFEKEGVIPLDKIKKDLKNQKVAKAFKKSYDLWRDDLKSQFLDDKTVKKFFISKGNTYLKIYGGLAIVVAFIVFIFTLMDPLPAAIFALGASVVLGVVAIISLVMPQKVGGRWTPYGMEYDAKWQNFKKFIQDFSLIKDYPPGSVVVWNHYLVYATALGVADKVRKTMEMSLPADELSRSDIYLFHYYGGYVILSSSLDTGMSTATGGNGGGGGVGGVGGGSGGGGGGAF